MKNPKWNKKKKSKIQQQPQEKKNLIINCLSAKRHTHRTTGKKIIQPHHYTTLHTIGINNQRITDIHIYIYQQPHNQQEYHFKFNKEK